MEETKVLDSNGNELVAGDSIIVTQNLKPKWAKEIKKGTAVKNIRLVDNDVELVEGRVDGTVMYLKTCFVKKHVKKK
jgi:protein PhnA